MGKKVLSRKKIRILSIIFLIFLCGVVVYFVALKPKNNTKKSVNVQLHRIEACDVLSKQVAKSYLGVINQSSTKQPQNAVKNTDIKITQCSYTQKTSKNPKSINLLIRSALTKQGAENNKVVFGSGIPQGSKKIRGYGNDAFWTQATGQLNMLYKHNWYILSVGGAQANKRSLDDAKKIATQIIENS